MGWLIGIVIAICLLAAFLIILSDVTYISVFKPKRRKKDKNRIIGVSSLDTGMMNSINSWYKDNLPERISIRSDDGLKLSALNYGAEEYSEKWAVILHGYKSNAREMKYFAMEFYERGFNVLSPDLRGHGGSEGKYIGMGFDDRMDAAKWVNLLVSSNPDCKIVLFGVSMGAATALMTAAEPLPENVKCIISDCAFSDLLELAYYKLKRVPKAIAAVAIGLVSAVMKVRAGYTIKDASPVKMLKSCSLPILYIHGDKDAKIPVEMANTLYESTPSYKEILIVGGARHASSALTAEDVYWEKIERFTDKFLQE